jgi:hypothetical protein
VGSTVISATVGNVSGQSTLTVTNAELVSITLSPATASVNPNATQQFTATGTFTDNNTQDLTDQVTWATFDPVIASISNVAGTKGLATGLQSGTTAITATSGAIVGTAELVVLSPTVTNTFPRDNVVGIRGASPVVFIQFNQAMLPGSLTTQTANGPCTGTLQLSTDNFATCVGFTGQPIFDVGATGATATPLVLQATTTHRIRVRGTVTNAGGTPIGEDFTQATGFTTATGGNCATGLVISQIYGGGGNNQSVFRNDFIELHNGGSTPADLSGFAVQYASINGATWQVTALPSVVVPPGGYFLIQEAVGANATALLPTPDVVTVGPAAIPMSATAGKVALTPFTTQLVGATPALGFTNDLLGYGGASTFEGTSLGATANPTGALRNNNGCNDSNINSADFTIGTPVPRNSAATPVVCACP